MAEMALLASAVSAAGSIVGGAAARSQAKAEGAAMQRAAEFEATELRKKADEERAAGQREAMQEREKAARVASRATAVAASSGAGVENPTILGLLEDTAAEGEMQAGAKKYASESRARGYLDQGAMGIWNANQKAASLAAKGDAAFTGSLLEGFGTAASGIYKYKTGSYGKKGYG